MSVETGFADWTVRRDGGQRSDTIAIGETMVRVGVTHDLELQVEWTPFATERVRDRLTGAVSRDSGVGDLMFGAKLNLRNPDGDGLSIAVQPTVTVPVGTGPAGAGDWGAGVVVPFSYELGHGLTAEFAAQVDAAPNGSSAGRHLAYSGTWSLGIDVTPNLNATVEYQALRDEDPGGASTASYGGISFAWMTSDRLQLDIGAIIGLNRAADDLTLSAGISRRF